MRDRQLSPHFKLSEFCDTWMKDYRDKNFHYGKMHPYLDDMQLLCDGILEPLRKYFMVPVMIYSGFRYSITNADNQWDGLDYAVRTVRQRKNYDGRSPHTRGQAADIYVPGIAFQDVWLWFINKCPNAFGQVRHEVSGRFSWIHVSLPCRSIDSLGGALLYGQVQEPYQDSAGRWYYKQTVHIDWNDQSDWETRARRVIAGTS